ncbi:DUF4349 domain-containing protein [Nocardioides carbamazepini]|uniref:DUF4349 domain-containing protein n=1 Tax=Nocardioides carbamazepini TaxID=2854259 RepID=UPI00214A6EB1|nr:DUF4349 domain-containing protein [Nocardioides carbamazepini]MCR1786540.1 DUF4349 domain-containing protein [Nocardioides carbamazepini]
MQTSPRRTALVLAGFATVVALAGCSSADDSGGSGGAKTSTAGLAASERDATGAADAEAPAAVPAGDDAEGSATAPQPAVISTGTVSLEAEDVGHARLQVRKVVDAHQGTVGEQETTTGEKGALTTARLVLRVPSDRFDEVVTALEEVATPTGTTTNGEDVSAEVVDVDARIRAQRKSVGRIETLLARAETIEQIVAIEAQLASRQADLDALESRQRWLSDQTSLSTITVYIERPTTRHTPEDDTADGFLGGLEKGWDAFVDGLGAVLVVVGFLVPWLVLVAMLGIPAWLVLRRRPRGRTGAA